MQLTNAIISSLLAAVAAARPKATSDDETVPQKSRITAFVVDEKGVPSVECWEIGSVADSAQVQRADGSKTTVHSLSLAANDELSGLDVLTWPSLASIYPPPTDSIHSQAGFDIAFGFNLFNVQSGLINFSLSATAHGKNINANDDDDVETHYFAPSDGDDWFYFEDSSTTSDAKEAVLQPSPFHVSSVSGSNTELLHAKYKKRPSHKVIHKGACDYTGIKTATDASARSGVTVQVNFSEDL
ncbi:hypothetical protein BST61_g7676 [Cercospora zeina]